MSTDKKEELRKKLGQEMHAARKLREGFDSATKLYIDAELSGNLAVLLDEGTIVASIEKSTGRTAYQTTIKGFKLYQPTPEKMQTLWPSASLEELKSVSPKDPIAFIKQLYTDER